MTFTYSYDPVLVTTDGQYSSTSTSERIYDYANDNAVTVGVTINSQTYSMTSNDDSLEDVSGITFDGVTSFDVGADVGACQKPRTWRSRG